MVIHFGVPKVQAHVRKAHEQAVRQAEEYMETEQTLLDDENPAAKLAAYLPYAKVTTRSGRSSEQTTTNVD